MALKIRRGLEADRSSVTPEEGEFLYVTDTGLVYIGDGSTAGGNLIAGGGGGGVETYADFASFPMTGTTGILYIAEDTGFVYYWDGAAYQQAGGGGSFVESVTGDGVDNTDPLNPVLTFPEADEVIFTPAGGVVATDVQAAIEELDAEIGNLVTSLSTDISFNFDGMGSVVLVNSRVYFRVANAGTISGWSIVAEGTSPTCTIDVWKIASGTSLPTVANTITASAKPALSTGNAVKSTTLTGWTTTITADDIICVNIDACSAATKIQFTIYR